uniref:TIL domain-containing protein n=1 Tax=Labrus bergylta TaxID=56723 RepID=A0A3Q3GTN9_9LABR
MTYFTPILCLLTLHHSFNPSLRAALTCPPTMEYGTCVSSCQRRCSALSIPQHCGEECEEGCFVFVTLRKMYSLFTKGLFCLCASCTCVNETKRTHGRVKFSPNYTAEQMEFMLWEC